MHQLRHVWSNDSTEWYLPNPPRGDNDSVIMENLQALKGVKNFNLSEVVVKRIPNIKKLSLVYDEQQIETSKCLSYLQYLSKLESFHCRIEVEGDEFLKKISFPKSLKKLTLVSLSGFDWERILEKIGSVPFLQKLTLVFGKWETIGGQFPSLKVLTLSTCGRLESWMVSESSHFPRLQELHLFGLHEEIPSEIGEIAMLKSILLENSNYSVVESAKKLVDDLEELHGEQLDLHVRVRCRRYAQQEALQHLASPNFHIDFGSQS